MFNCCSRARAPFIELGLLLLRMHACMHACMHALPLEPGFSGVRTPPHSIWVLQFAANKQNAAI